MQEDGPGEGTRKVLITPFSFLFSSYLFPYSFDHRQNKMGRLRTMKSTYDTTGRINTTSQLQRNFLIPYASSYR